MKDALKYLGVLFLAACLMLQASGQSAKTIIKGKINLDDQYEALLSFQSDGTNDAEQITTPLSASGEFTFRFDITAPEFIQLVIYPTARNKQLAINFPLYVKPRSKTDMYLSYNDSTYLTLKGGKITGENKALITYSNFRSIKLRSMFFHQPKADSIKLSLQEYFDVADEYVSRFEVKNQSVKNYLSVSAMNNYLAGTSIMRPGTRGASFDVSDLPESVVEVYNLPEALLLPETGQALSAYMALAGPARADHPKASDFVQKRIAFFNGRFLNPQLRKRFAISEVQGYIRSFQFTANTDRDEATAELKRLTKQIADPAVEERMLRSFAELFSTVEGSPLPDVVFKDAQGLPVSLKSFEGKAIYIDLWASWCVPCIVEIPNLRKLEQDYKDKNIVFLSISLDEDKDAWHKKMEELQLTGHQLETGDSGFERIMNVQGIPHFILYDASGKLLRYRAPRPGTAEIRKIFDQLP